jgi:hypothetical protein
MPRSGSCTVETVVEVVREVEAKGERPSRKSLAERVKEKCGYEDLKTAYKHVKDAERLGLIVCIGWGEKAECRTAEFVSRHGEEVASTLGLLLIGGFDVREEEELGVRRALAHVVSLKKNKVVVVRIIRLWKLFKEYEALLKHYIRKATSMVYEESGWFKIEVIRELAEEFKMLKWNANVYEEANEVLPPLEMIKDGNYKRALELLPPSFSLASSYTSFAIRVEKLLNAIGEDLQTLSTVADLMVDGIDCRDLNTIFRLDPWQVLRLKNLCEKLGGRLDSERLSLIESQLPRVTELLRIFIELKKIMDMMQRVLNRLDDEVKNLRRLIVKMLDHYKVEKRLEGSCSYCEARLREDIEDIVEELMEVFKERPKGLGDAKKEFIEILTKSLEDYLVLLKNVGKHVYGIRGLEIFI